MQCKTRNSDNNIVGSDKEISAVVLPTRRDAVRHYNFQWNLTKIADNGRNPSYSEVSELTLDRVEAIWHKSSIPVVSRRTMNAMLRKELDVVQKLNKSFSRDQQKDCFKNKLANYLENANKLFDVAACKCSDFLSCKCVFEKKVPRLERDFLIDQRTTRTMLMTGIDAKTTSHIKKQKIRKMKEEASIKKRARREWTTLNDFLSSSCHLDNTEFLEPHPLPGPSPKSESECVVEIPAPLAPPEPANKSIFDGQNRVDISTFARTCDRFGIPDRPAAALASALLHDVKIQGLDGILDIPSSSFVIDRSKVRRERAKIRGNLHKQDATKKENLKALYFDGRIDETLYIEKTEDGKMYRRKRQEDHLSLIQEPGSKYIGHVIPPSGKALDICNAIWEYTSQNEISLSELVCLGCDGCPTNTGKNGGVIRKLEEKLGRPMQWVVCQLHCNELPLRHLLEKLDGKTSGPHGFVGPLGKSLADCHTLDPVDFQPIECELDGLFPDTITDLSSDQQYLLDICKAVSSGVCPTGLAGRSPGKLSHARWLTTANRILRLYISTRSPSSSLQELAKFVMKVYAPGWFTVKCRPTIKDGATNLWRIVSYSSYLKAENMKVVQNCLKTNGYFAHPENLLLAMIADPRKHIRELGLRRIIAARARNKEKTVRRFEIPAINFSATEYVDLINWQNIRVTEPPLTKHLTDEDLRRLIHQDESDILAEVPLLKLPPHTQAVERSVKEVTAASKQVCDMVRRDGVIRARLLDREIRPHFETKKQFKA